MRIYNVLALEGIKKNKQLYLPYIISSVCIIAITYIVSYFCYSKTIISSVGGEVISSIMLLGYMVMALFSLIFIFYTHSFLFKRRKKEFGLYNVLGLAKKDICKIVFLDNIYVDIITIVLGLGVGILFSKFAELAYFKIVAKPYSIVFNLPTLSLMMTLICFLGIYFLILVSSIISVYKNDTIAFLKADSSGEKAPRANFLLALVGLIILAFAYYLAITIDDPVQAMLTFFFAVIMVVVATYLLFIAGSVTLCKILAHNKKYYYKLNHFISVSSMSFRMKRNGSGLASICILATMVLVMLSSTSSLYFGAKSSNKKLFPYEYSINYNYDTYDELINANETITSFVELKDFKIKEKIEYHNINFYLPLEGNKVIEDSKTLDYANMTFIDVDEYNKIYGTDYVLKDDECLLYEYIGEYKQDSIVVGDNTYKVIDRANKMVTDYVSAVSATNNYFFVVNDLEPISNSLKDICKNTYIVQFDVYNDSLSLYNLINEEYTSDTPYFFESSLNSLSEFYNLYGSLFYLGISLSIAFVIATVCIMYYKQVVEGYEDQKRFAIMKKLGLDDRQIRKSINSQLLTVFFLPLVGALSHLLFAHPMIEKLLSLFLISDIRLFFITSIICFVSFSIAYFVIYKLTSNVYYKIVS